MSKQTGDYVLGTGDDELQRLGLQHRVWRPHMLAAWQRAGITTGSRVLDVGAGPGYATIDLAEIVGSRGNVTGIERSPHYFAHAQQTATNRGLHNVDLIQADLMDDDWTASEFDAAWCRWVACFVSSPAALVAKMVRSLRTGGVAIFHEYVNYESWRMAPPCASHDDFVRRVTASWRESGGEPDIALELPTLLANAGMKITHTIPLVFAITPRDYMWQWPISFIETNVQRQVDLGGVDETWADRVRADIARACAAPNALMITPAVLEIIATKM